MEKFFIALAILCFTASCSDTTSGSDNVPESSVPPPASISYNIVATYPHDTSSYTQGLIWQNNTLYEGTGIEGQSHLMKVDLASGKPTQSIALDIDIFGEGITMLDDKIYQLTWQNNKVLVYDAKTFKKIKELSWEHDGWGLTNNGTDLIVSTGESNLYFVDPGTFKIKRTVEVLNNNGPQGNLNELEYVNGVVFANIYLTDYIVKINPANGQITGKLDLSGLLEKAGKHVDDNGGLVLNGIAYDSTKKSFYITGKKWPLLFEMKLN